MYLMCKYIHFRIECRATNPGGYIPPIFDLHHPNNFDFCTKKSLEEMSRKTFNMGFSTPKR